MGRAGMLFSRGSAMLHRSWTKQQGKTPKRKNLLPNAQKQKEGQKLVFVSPIRQSPLQDMFPPVIPTFSCNRSMLISIDRLINL